MFIQCLQKLLKWFLKGSFGVSVLSVAEFLKPHSVRGKLILSQTIFSSGNGGFGHIN